MKHHLVLLGAIALFGCGPGASQPSNGGDDAGHSSTETSAGDHSSTGDESEGTAIAPGCGNGVLEDGEWCYERTVVNKGSLEGVDLYRIAAGADGFVIWSGSGFTALPPTQAELLLETQPFYAAPGGYAASSVLLPAKLSTDGVGRVDFLHWAEDVGSVEFPDNACQRIWVVPGASRPPPDTVSGTDGEHAVVDFECARDSFFVPIDVDGQGAPDSFFALDTYSGLGALYRRLAVYPGRPKYVDVELAQPIPQATSCTFTMARAGDVNGDGFEDGVGLGRDCPEGSSSQVLVFLADAQGGLRTDPLAFEIPVEEPVLSLEVSDLDGDDHDDVIVAGDEFAAVLRGQSNGLAQPVELTGEPTSILAPSRPEVPEEVRYLPVSVGQLDEHPELEVVLHTNGGLSAVSADGTPLGTISEPTASYAVFDINMDGLGDIGLISSDGDIVVHLSNP